MLTGLIVCGRTRTFVQLPQPHRRGEHDKAVHRRKIVRVERDIADTHVVKVADPTVVGPVGNGTDQQRLVIGSESVRPGFGSHVDAIGVHPDFAAIPDPCNMVPFAICQIGSTVHVIKHATIGDAEGCLAIVQL